MDFAKMGLYKALETLDSKLTRLEPYIGQADEEVKETYDKAVDYLMEIMKGVAEYGRVEK